MNRRQAVVTGLGAGAALAMGVARHQAQAQEAGGKGKFKMKYAPHFGMFRNSAGKDLVDQLKFAADQGFHAWEDNGMSRKSPEVQAKLAQEMTRLGMTMGVFVSGLGSLVSPPEKMKDEIVKKMKGYLEVAKRVNATWTTVVPGGVNQRLEWDYMTANCIENLKVAAGAAEPAGLIMVLEPLNWFANHPGLFLRKVPQAYQICKAVGSPSCKILDDLYHAQVQEGNLIPNMQKAWSEIAYIQVGDNPGRKEPTTGEINYRN
ncbi:unnamed protein product, partial [marine sediment metagenome]